MKRLLMLSCSVLALAGAAHAADIALLPHVPDNTTLSATKSTAYDYVVRDDFSNGFGAPPLTYKKSNSVCPLNAGAGDGGSQVPSADGKCWLAQFTGPLDPRYWGQSYPIQMYVDTTGSDASGSNYCVLSASKCKTINQALSQLFLFNVKAQSPIITIGTATFTENIGINSLLIGAGNNNPFLGYFTSIPGSLPVMPILSGNGSASTIISGGNNDGSGNSFCYGVLANDHAAIALRNLSVTAVAAGSSCLQSDLFIEFDGQIYILGDVKLLAANGNLVAGEEHGEVYVTPGCGGSCSGALTLAGNAGGNGINLDSQAMFQADSTVAIANSPVFSGGFLILQDSHSIVKLSGAPGVTSGATITGSRFSLTGLSDLILFTPPAVWPGTPGTLRSGSRYEASDSTVCLGGVAGCPNVTASTALGAGGSYVVAGGDAYSGFVQINMGAAALSSGSLQLGFIPGTVAGGVVTPAFTNGTASWPNTDATTSGFVGAAGVTINWAASAPLVNGQSYFLGYAVSPLR